MRNESRRHIGRAAGLAALLVAACGVWPSGALAAGSTEVTGQVTTSDKKVFPGADERTPSRAQYFSWINNNCEGATADQAVANLGFFKWLHDEYGMVLDIYTFDAGALDGCRCYGSLDSAHFKRKFPEGFKPIAEKAAEMGTGLGIWGGPDGFGNTPEQEAKRIGEMVSLCRDCNFVHFKFDGVCGPLREEKTDAFIRMMTECRKYCPDLILQNHLLNLHGAAPYATTFAWGESEMYVDVMIGNSICAPNHRAEGMRRGLTPGLTRLAEDHGTCISSCLDGWDDEMVLTSFARALVMSPEMYGNPWLLSDSEFPKLARIYNLHRKYRDILVDGMLLPESYGPHAVSRGDSARRILVLRNLNWNDATYPVKLDKQIGLAAGGKVELRQLHPTEKELGVFSYGETVNVKVGPFAGSLLYAGTTRCDEPGVSGVDYNVIRNVPGRPVEIELLGMPGSSATVGLLGKGYKSAKLDGADAPQILKGSVNVEFPGTPLAQPFHRKLADMQPVQTPADTGVLYDATVFAADNNALEVRSILRSGWSSAPSVKKAQEAFFNQPEFPSRGTWDRFLFDDRPDTGFWPCTRFRGVDMTIDGGCFRLDLGEVLDVDELVFNTGDGFGLEPLYADEGYWVIVSEDLVTWRGVQFLAGIEMHIPVNGKMRYLKLSDMPQRFVSVEGFRNGKPLPRAKWRASNLFAANTRGVQKTWRAEFTLDEIPASSYLCIAAKGKHGREGAYAAAKIGGEYVGCPDRAPSYPSNVWSYMVVSRDSNYTYYLPLDDSAKGKPIEAFVLASDPGGLDLKPEVWITTRQTPFEKVKLTLNR